MDDEIHALRAEVGELRTEVGKLTSALDEFLPLVRAYLDPEQTGPRGYFMRRRLAAQNGAMTDG